MHVEPHLREVGAAGRKHVVDPLVRLSVAALVFVAQPTVVVERVVFTVVWEF